MLRSRYFGEKAVELVDEREIPGAINSAIGRGAGAVSTCMVVREHGYMMGNYGLHGHARGKGANMKEPMAELFGTCIVVNKGKRLPAKCVAPSQLHRGQRW
jgi:TPP-dependent pyruvate/acetoin dehydrogenase alpha subunit